MRNIFFPDPKANLKAMLRRFILNFTLVNTLLTLFIGINYIHVIPHFQALTSSPWKGFYIWCFFVISFIAQISLIFFFSFICLNLANAIVRKRFIIFTLAIILMTAIIFSLIADSIAFHIYHMHYLSVGIAIFKVNAFSQVITLSYYEILIIAAAIGILLFCEACIAWLTWCYVKNKKMHNWCRNIAILLMFCVVASYSLNFWARKLPIEAGLQPNIPYLMAKATRFIPYYNEAYELLVPGNHSLRFIQTAQGNVDLQTEEINHPLAYPKQALICQPAQQPFNIVFIVIDTWRYDAMNAKVTPAIYQFAQKSLQFQNNWSGGNCTKAGLFSLFYGIPENYWEAVLAQKRGPEFIHQLLKANYAMGIFSSAQLNFPAFDRTIFREVQSLKIYTPGNTTIARDLAITQEFKNFIAQRDSHRPFFSFIFYDAAHNYCDPSVPAQHPFNPWQKTCNRLHLDANSNALPYMNRYLNAVSFVDSQVKQVLASLEQQHLLDHTLVVITADHGEEINDAHSGYWQHASAYTSYQLHTPLIVYWPGKKPTAFTHLTTHYDINPTLLTQVLNCKNPPQDYTIGESLFDPSSRPLLLSGSYADYAIISNNQILRVYRGGDIEMDDKFGHPLENMTLQMQPLRAAFKEVNAYFR